MLGSKQRTQSEYVKSNRVSLTFMSDGFIITSTIKAREGHDVVVSDLSNEVLNIENNENTLMLLKAKLVE